MTIITVVLLAGASWTVAADYSAPATFHAIGAAQAGTQGTVLAPGVGGKGGAYAAISNPAVTPGQVLALQLGVGGVGAGAAGTDTWLKNAASAKILQAIGGASVSANIGTVTNPGGSGGILAASADGSYGNVAIPGFGGSGGGSSGAPDNLIAGFNGVGSNGGDTNYAVGQFGGTGGGAPSTNHTPPWDAPGQVWLGITGAGGLADIGRGGGRTGPPLGVSGARGANNPFGTLDALAGGGALSQSANALFRTGGNGRNLLTWFDSVSFADAGPGGGGGGGSGGGNTNLPAAWNCGAGGNGGLGAGGGGSGGVGGPAGSAVLGSAQLWAAFTGALANPGNGGAGAIVIEYTQFVPAGSSQVYCLEKRSFVGWSRRSSGLLVRAGRR